MGKKIAIVTIYGIPNFGSVLQAYALQKYLSKAITDSDIRLINYEYRGFIHRVKRIRETGFVPFIKNEIAFRLRKIPNSKKRRIAKFIEFRKTYLKETRLYPNKLSLRLSKEIRSFDVFITGSDQVWNTKELHGDLSFLLDFVPNSKIKLSYSSSFGIDYIGDSYKKNFKRLLNNFESIGVREKKGKSLIEELGVTIPTCVTCDPTLLLDAKEYGVLAAKSEAKTDFPYILVYGLSYAFNPMPAILDLIKLAVLQYKCKVVFLSKGKIPFEGDADYIQDASPCDFLKYVANAKYIVTSSLHGTLFSIIFRKPFTAIAPKSGDTRIFDVLDDLNIRDVLVEPDSSQQALTSYNIYTENFENHFKDYIGKSKDYLAKYL